MKKKVALLFSLLFYSYLCLNNLFAAISERSLYKLHEKALHDVSRISNDSLSQRENMISDFLKRERINSENDSTGINSKELEILFLMHHYDEKKQYDSVYYYYKKIKQKSENMKILGEAELYLFEKMMFEKKYLESIRCLYNALDYFKKNNIVDKEIKVYLKLAALYKKIKNKDLSKEMDSILMNYSVNKSISKLQKSQIYINHASYIASLGKNKEAVRLLKSLDVNGFSDEPYVLKYYYDELNKRYTKLKLLDSAKVYLDKMYAIPNLFSPEDEVMKNIYYAGQFSIEGNPIIALKYIDSAKRSTAFKYVEQFDLIKFYKVEYEANEALGNYRKALQSLSNYHSVRNDLKNFSLNLNASILNFKLNHDKKIKDLEAKSEMNALIMDEKKKFYIFSTFFVSASVLILIFLIILHIRKKKRLKLQYENDKMKEISEIKNNFIENLSHEIRTPITITTGYLQMITNNAMDYSKIVKYADLTIRNNEQIIGMLNNFLTLLKLDKKPVERKMTSEKMEVFLRESIFSFQGVAEIKGIYVYYKSNIKPNQNIVFPYEDLRKIINNIVSNALKYTSPTYGIYVHTFIDENGLNIIIKDEGIGIDKKEQKLIFDRFYQTKNNLTNGGFGIGLSLVHELITKLNGAIKLDSEKNVGSVFTIQLPLNIENPLLYIDENIEVFQSISKPELPTIDHSNNLPKILIVDDNIEMIGYLKDLLEPSFACTFAFDGAQVLDFAKKKQYDIILSDLRMPLIDGYQLKTELNKLKNYETTPFIILTASAEAYLTHQKEEYGIHDYLIKPFDGTELLTRIQFHLEKGIYTKQLQDTDADSIHINTAYSEFMDKVNNIVQENLANNEFSIGELAKKCGYSHKQFAQIVQQKTGLTPIKFILEIRLQKAYNLIVKDNYDNISEVLYTVGLNSRSYFNKVFTKRFGLKPGELIKKVKVENLV
ncbi:response regulator [Kordia sp. YSTF-M3]|uniref:histidine kinase n=1 Tax=Kordia aestuariivivens TaxID=2759037 RepID=A0ABR7QF31_9FLAO|nr:ATP-binding protein [Kordia aestuariivivens]MBC8756904.1 response regulator [Kordia aestuariivivens]